MLKKSVPRYLLLGICVFLIWQILSVCILEENRIVEANDARESEFASFEFLILEKINSERRANNLLPLANDALLAKTAKQKSQDMIARNYFSHRNPEGNFVWNLLEKNGYKYKYAGENLARNFSDAKSIVDAWMQSATHRKNILEENFSEIGISVEKITKNGKDYFYVTAIFGAKRSSLF